MVPEHLPVSQKASSSWAIVANSARISPRGRPFSGRARWTAKRSSYGYAGMVRRLVSAEARHRFVGSAARQRLHDHDLVHAVERHRQVACALTAYEDAHVLAELVLLVDDAEAHSRKATV